MNDETNRAHPDEPIRPQVTPDELARGLERLERALRAGPPSPRDHGPVRAAMPAMAAAELRGERIADLFPAEVAHLDLCAACAEEYGVLLDALLELEAASLGGEAAPPAAHMPARLALGLRLRGWVIAAAQAVLAGAQRSTVGVEQAVDALVERLGAPGAPDVLGGAAVAPVPLAFDAGDAGAALIAATWRATELLAGQASAAELAARAVRGELAAQAHAAAEEAARAVGLPRAVRARFTADFTRRVEADPAAVIALGSQDAA